MSLPIRTRLTVWYTALLAGALLLFSATVYIVMNTTLVSSVDGGLRARVAQIQREVRQEGGRLAVTDREERSDVPSIPYILLNTDGRVANGNPSPTVSRWLSGYRPDESSAVAIYSTEGIRLAIGPIRRSGHIAGHILVWQSAQELESARRTLLLALLGSGLALLLVASGGGYALAGRMLEPVSLLTRTAASISASGLHRRVPVADTQDELTELATTFNAMIGRLEMAVERERSFTAHASHELRAPLSVIRAESTLALDHPRPGEEYRAALGAIDEQVEEMESLLASLLVLARVETPSAMSQEPVDVAELVRRAAHRASRSMDHPETVLDCTIAPDLWVKGSPALLQHAIRNVIENALKVSGVSDRVCITAARANGQVVVAVRDSGPGIPLEHQSRIFEPFYQVDGAHTPGSSHGLGLAICKRIVEAHRGDITVQSSPGAGTTFRISLPAFDTISLQTEGNVSDTGP